MRNARLPLLVCILAVTAGARAGSVRLGADLRGAHERPDPVATEAEGWAWGQLDGEPGSWVFRYQLDYLNLDDVTAGHVHRSQTPADAFPPDQSGPPVHVLDSLAAGSSGEWRFDDAANPLTDTLAQDLIDGRLYVNLHTTEFPNGEIRGQLEQEVEVPLVPLPAAVWMGLAGLGAVMALHRRLGNAGGGKWEVGGGR